MRNKKIDTSLRERHGIINLLERLKLDGLTLDEVEEIGSELQKSGSRALSPLVRRLWSERSSDVISRYAYVLDFFDEEEWMGKLVQIALQRHDLDEAGKTVLLAALKGYGVDITAPPFAALLSSSGFSRDGFVKHLLEAGEEGQIAFMEDFLNCSVEVQLALVRQLPPAAGAVETILEVLIWMENEDVAGEALAALGRTRSREAANILARYRREAPGSRVHQVERSLRRLAFLGIVPDSPLPRPSLSFHAASASPPDAAGYRAVWVSRWLTTHRVAALYVQVHDMEGIKGGWGSCGSADHISSQHRDAAEEDGLVPVPVDYALLLLRDAMARGSDGEMPLPAAFHVQRPRLFAGENMAPVHHEPTGAAEEQRECLLPRATEDMGLLLDEDEFAGWFIATSPVYDFAEEWDRLERDGQKRDMDRLVQRFCRDLIAPHVDRIRRRLLLTAELMEKGGKEPDMVALTRAAARTLPVSPAPCHGHPFLRRFALESLAMARDALAEGFDLRDQAGEDEEGDCGE